MVIKPAIVTTQVSSKFTSSALSYLDKRGHPTTRLFDVFDYPEEFLRDSHGWLPIEDAERFFQIAVSISEDAQFARYCGLHVPELQSWGALDNVFKMMGIETKTFYDRLGRYFSYFLAPVAQFDELERTETSVKFIMPFEKASYPLLFDFLTATLEALPRYTGKPAANLRLLSDNQVQISWEDGQRSLFTEDEDSRVVNPKLVDQMSRWLEQSEKKLTALGVFASGVAHEINNPLAIAMGNLSRFKEYFESVQKYLEESRTAENLSLEKKHDLEFILSETPLMLEETLQSLIRVKDTVRGISQLDHPEAGKETRRKLASSGSFLPMEK